MGKKTSTKIHAIVLVGCLLSIMIVIIVAMIMLR